MGDAVNSSQSTRKNKTIFNGRQFNFFAREEENSRENGLRLLPKSALPNFGIPLSSEDGCSQVNCNISLSQRQFKKIQFSDFGFIFLRCFWLSFGNPEFSEQRFSARKVPLLTF
jgi:hypothetical protein